MPTYDYKCPACGAVFEAFHKMSETVVIVCEECGAVAEKQVGGGSGILFKGPGFYHTDYRVKHENEESER